MTLNLEHIQTILNARHFYYAEQNHPPRTDERWSLGFYTDFMLRHLTPSMHVLDVGCGKGHILMEMVHGFQYGLGIDNDPEHIQMAEEAKRAAGVTNVDFRLLEYPGQAAQLPAESFDLLMSIRGPLPDTLEGIQAAYRLLRPDGLLFCQEIGELHYQEVTEVFGRAQEAPEGSGSKRHWDMLQKNGFDVRLAADNLTKLYFRDIYTWFDYQCNLWTWLGVPLPEADDPRIALMAERHSNPAGEIALTAHVFWIAAVKK